MSDPKRRRLLVLDVVLAAVFVAVCLWELSHHLEDGPYRGPLSRSVAIDVVVSATLVLRRTYPRACLLAMNLAWLVPSLVVAHTPLFFGNLLPFLLVTYTAARYTTGASARWSWLSGLVMWIGMIARAGDQRHLVANPVLPLTLSVVAWLIGTVLRRLAEQQHELATAYAALEREQAGREQRAAERERARIAVDMHDTVASAISLMVVQVGNARMGLERTGASSAILRTAEQTGRDALVELRRSLGVLRGTQSGSEVVTAQPAAGAAPGATGPAVLGQLRGRVRRAIASPVWDLLLAVTFAAVAVFESVDLTVDDGFRGGPVWLSVALGIATCVPLAWRRRLPLTAYVAMLALVTLPGLVVEHSLFLYGTLAPLCLVCFTLSRREDGWVARTTWVAGALLAVVGGLRTPHAADLVDVVFSTVFTAAAWATGRTMRRFDRQGEELRRTLRSLADEQADREDAAVDDERNRIAAEMHDVVAHAVSSMVVQVGATRMEGGPAGELDKLQEAERAGRRALTELRTTLGLLRGEGEAALRPLPDLRGLEQLADGFRSAGLDVVLDLHVEGEVTDSAALTTYRIVQEALTNALKHGGAGRVDARVQVSAGRVAVRVSSPIGPSVTRLPSGGHGLAGMRERVALFAGSLDAGVHGGRFVVEAVLRLAPEPVNV